jgi:hypothetical protein
MPVEQTQDRVILNHPKVSNSFHFTDTTDRLVDGTTRDHLLKSFSTERLSSPGSRGPSVIQDPLNVSFYLLKQPSMDQSLVCSRYN